MSQNDGKKYNLRSRTNSGSGKNTVEQIPEKSTRETKKSSRHVDSDERSSTLTLAVRNSGLDGKIKTVEREDRVENGVESQNSEDNIPDELMDNINIAIKDLVKDITDDIIERINDIVLSEAALHEENQLDLNRIYLPSDQILDMQIIEEDEEDDPDYLPGDERVDDGLFSIFDDAAEELMMYPRKRLYLTKDRWKKDLTEQEIEKYSYMFEKMDSQKLSIKNILRSNLSKLEKEKAIYKFLHSSPGSPITEQISKLIEERKKQNVSESKLEELDRLEDELQALRPNKRTIKEQILMLPIDIQRKSVVYDRYLQLESMGNNNAEYAKLSEWLNWVLRLPWNKSHSFDLSRFQIKDSSEDLTVPPASSVPTVMKQIMEELNAVYGLQNAKEEILLFVLKKLLTPLNDSLSNKPTSVGGQILAIEGPPGVGKTFLLKHLASALKIPFESIPLGGCKDASFLDGHGFTYEGSTPGRIVQALKNMQCNDGIIYFDEIDKLSDSAHGQEVSALMLHILDPTQNKEFYDKYLSDIPIDLSKIFFVLSINDREKIDPVLRQRLFIIKIPSPTLTDKLGLSKQCMIPSIEKEFGFESNEIIMPTETLQYIIQTKTNDEKGVRNLQHLLLSIYKRLFFMKNTFTVAPSLNTDLKLSFWINDFKLPFTVTPSHIELLLKGTEQTDNDLSHQRMFI